MEKKKIRIFISSPGDVQQERNIARNVVQELNSLYAKYAKLEVLMWEDFPLTTESTFQEGIDYFLKNEPIDFAVFILWSRLGTPLCTKFAKPDGSPYKSGTEYEYDLMCDLQRRNGSPRILTYVKTKEILPSVSTQEELYEFFKQKDGVKAFLKEHFYDESTNSNYAYLQFEEQTSFENKLKNHLQGLIKPLLGNVSEIKEWDGNPYVGLNSFEYEQSSIFFGRRHLVYDVSSQLLEDESQKRSLIVLGESGSGKSSFVKAGLLPFLCRSNKTDFRIVTPSMFGGAVYQGLLDMLVNNFSFLKDNPFMDELKAGVDEDTNFKHLAFAFKNNKHNDFILYIDQFEELFSDNQITEEERRKVILLLKGIVSTYCINIFMSMRSDFYNRFSLYGNLAQLKAMVVTIDIPLIGISEMSEIVDEPAKKACLKWEIDHKGNSLNEVVVKDASVIKDLPLIEFALSELYNLRDENNCLTFAAYEKIGRLRGAIVAYANNFYNRLTDDEKVALDEVLGYVISVSPTQRNTYVRRTTLLEELEKEPAHKSIVKKLIDAHIFVTGKNHNGEPTVTIVHETLINHWEIIQSWVNAQDDFLQSNTYYEQRAKHWNERGKSSKELIQERTALLEVEYFVYKYSKRLTEGTKDFLLASLKKERRQGIVWQTMLAVFLIISFVCFIYAKLIGYEYDADLNEWTSINDLSLPQMLSIQIPLLSILFHSLFLKYFGKPKYKTINYSLLYWSILFSYLMYLFNDVDYSYSLIFNLPILLVLISVLLDVRIRRLWRKRKVVSYNISDKWIERIKSIFVGFVLLFIVAFTPLVMTFVLQEKNEKLESTLVVADELFDGLNNISNMLSPSDNFYVNEKRRLYLEERFKDELQDTIPDDREYQYSTVLYNLGKPDRARRFLYYDKNWRDHLMMIKCLMLEGRYDLAEYAMTEYIEAKRVDNFGSLKTEDLIWSAEKMGRFDLAEKIYSLLEQKNVDISNVAFIVNKGHIHMFKNEIDSAVACYSQVIDFNNIIAQDFHLLSRFSAIDDAKLQYVADKIKVPFIPAYSVDDSLTTSRVYEKLQGDWVWYNNVDVNQRVLISIDSVRSYVRSHIYAKVDTTWNESFRLVSHIRFQESDKGLVWDEYNPITDENSMGILTEITDEYFVLKVVENGKPTDKNKLRVYNRFLSSDDDN